ncbi:unnamed protein product [Anisakis simplex]|uniref:Phospholipase C-beta C-terminal domain-containing protein n=1 Tax=Anisakis simplex TaxID=6269 RepID=A0A0M3JBK6_ANISI|nr:unnamed protein product [Anisakis simplex]
MINVAELKKDKCFIKLIKKLQKDMDELKKRHQKQRDSIQKQQQSNVEKLMCDSHKQSKKRTVTGTASNHSRHQTLSNRQSDPSNISPNMANSHKVGRLCVLIHSYNSLFV